MFWKMLLREYLNTVPELMEENMTQSTEPYIKIGENGLAQIVTGKNGNYIEFDEAYKVAMSDLKKGNTVNYSKLESNLPKADISDKELISKLEKINKIFTKFRNYKAMVNLQWRTYF